MIMVSPEAKKRKERFLANKKQFEGNYYAMQKAEYEKDHTVYFLEDGTITCITKEEITPKKEWKSFIFSKDQVKILDGKNLDLYRVSQNPDDENRLFYVGATRTKEHLHIVEPKQKYKGYNL